MYLVMAGASITDDAMQDDALQTNIATTYSKTVTAVNEALSGRDTTDLRNAIDDIIHRNHSKGNYVFVHIGGNNVTNTRPFSTATELEKSTITDDLNYIMNAIINARMIPLPASLTFRDYDDTTITNEENGSLPYNDNLIDPVYCVKAPDFCYEDGKPYLQMYEAIKNTFATSLQVDNIHLTSAGTLVFQQMIVDSVCKQIFTGEAPTEIS